MKRRYFPNVIAETADMQGYTCETKGIVHVAQAIAGHL
jgi:hypothetical protein